MQYKEAQWILSRKQILENQAKNLTILLKLAGLLRDSNGQNRAVSKGVREN